MCECYQIGGPWIDFDPSCPEHGHDAQRREREAEEERKAAADREADLDARIERLERLIDEQAERIANLEDDNREHRGDILSLTRQVDYLDSDVRTIERQVNSD